MTSSEGTSHYIDHLRVVVSHLRNFLDIYYHVGFYPLALDQVHVQTMQSLQITVPKHALHFERVLGYLLPLVNSRELT